MNTKFENVIDLLLISVKFIESLLAHLERVCDIAL